MAVKSVIDIEVNDGAFRKFAERFRQYQNQVRATPEAWARTSEEARRAVDASNDLLAAQATQTEYARQLTRSREAETRQLQDQDAIRRQGAQRELGIERQSRIARERQVAIWRNLSRSSRDFANHIADATRSLLRWSALTGIVSGIIGTGGLFGIDRLARSAGNARSSAFGLGLTPAEERSFTTNYSRVVNPQTFLGGVNEALHDISKRVSLYGAGIGENELKGRDTYEVSNLLLDRLKTIADNTDPRMMAQTIQSRNLDQFTNVGEMLRLRSTPRAELDQYRQSAERDRRTFSSSDETLRAWQSLQVQFTRAGQQIETVLINRLVNLAPELEHLSAAVTTAVSQFMSSPQLKEWIDALAKGIKWLGDYLSSPQFRKDIEDFLTEVNKLVDGSSAFISRINDLIGGMDGLQKGFDGTIRFAKTLASTVDDTGRSLGNFAHFVLDPLIAKQMGRPYTQDEATVWNQAHPDQPYNGPFANSDKDTAWEWDRMAHTWKRPKDYDPNASQLDWWQRWKQRNIPDWLNGDKVSASDPRGFRNHNYLNLTGEGTAGKDWSGFAKYRTDEEGIAAAWNQLMLNQSRGLSTIRDQIYRWNPPNAIGNTQVGTDVYVARVAREAGIDAGSPVDFRDPRVAAAVIASMARHENGRDVDPSIINRGVALGQQVFGAQYGIGQRPPSGTNVSLTIQNQTGANVAVAANQVGGR